MPDTLNISVANIVQEAQKLPDSEKLPYIRNELRKYSDLDTRSMVETYVLNQINQVSKDIVVFIRGINTRASWQEKFRSLLSKQVNTEVRIIKYGWFNPFSFWFPFFTRARPIQTVIGQLRDIQKTFRNDNISIVSHSFGTYIVGNILTKNSDIVINKLILCGSVLSEDFKWDMLPQKPVLIVNDVGAKDRWPVFAKAFSWGYGASGSYGFGHHMVYNRYHDLKHSGFFEDDFMNCYWIPFLKSGNKIESVFERKSPSIFYEFLPFIVKLVYVLSFIALLYFFVLS